ncbi:MAG: hypothetical protein WCK47_12440 [bacterium]|nr:hypothetical protein [Candidatus Sumerlaeota bacterium]
MSHLVGAAYLFSLFLLTFVVASVYSASQEVYTSFWQIWRQTFRRALKLLAVLAVLAITVYFLCKI